MRIKTCGGRRKPFALATPSTSSASHSDEADARPNDSDAGIKDGSENVHPGADDKAPDSANMTDNGEKEENAEDDGSVDLDWSEEDICLICRSSDNQLTFCTTSDCPVALHESCVNCSSLFEDKGEFYCPYCVYKKEIVKAKGLRRKAMLAKKNLFKFMGSFSKDPAILKDGGMEEGPNVSPVAGTGYSVDCQGGLGTYGNNEGVLSTQDEQVEGTTQEPNRPNIFGAHGSENSGDGQRTKDEDVQRVENNNDDDNREDQQWAEALSPHNLDEENNLFDATAAERHGTEAVLDGGKGVKRIAASTVPRNSGIEFDSSDFNAETVEMHKKHVKLRATKKACPSIVNSPSCVSVPQNAGAGGKEAVEASTGNRCQGPENSPNAFIKTALGHERRRRLNWTAEEEDMLKEGVQKFSGEVKKNIPWRKILEYGHHVFNPTRAPADLKDKWKNVVAKEPSAKG